jgi:exopolysaccharide production protein ExoZ
MIDSSNSVIPSEIPPTPSSSVAIPRPRVFETLQAYRGIAALLVVLYHVTAYGRDTLGYLFLKGAFIFGFTGVDFFFVLSGFIIFSAHAYDIGRPDRTSTYLLKRFVRVYPLYLLVTSIKLISFVILPTLAKPYEKSVGTIVKSLFLLPQRDLPIIGAAWTLSYEVFFYAVFGLIVHFGVAKCQILLGVWLVVLLTAQIGHWLGATLIGHYVLNFLLNERLLEFALGAFSAYYITHHKLRYSREIAIAGVMLFLIAGWAVVRGGTVYSYTASFGIPSLLLITGSAAYEASRRPTIPWLWRFLGSASYSIYLTHAMFVSGLFLAFRKVMTVARLHPALEIAFLAVGATVGGIIFYQWVERPLLSFVRARLRASGYLASAKTAPYRGGAPLLDVLPSE